MSSEIPPIFAISALKGCTVVGSDDKIGKVKDFLFLDDRWKVRWLVVDTGGWLSGRKVLIHPPANRQTIHICAASRRSQDIGCARPMATSALSRTSWSTATAGTSAI